MCFLQSRLHHLEFPWFFLHTMFYHDSSVLQNISGDNNTFNFSCFDERKLQNTLGVQSTIYHIIIDYDVLYTNLEVGYFLL